LKHLRGKIFGGENVLVGKYLAGRYFRGETFWRENILAGKMFWLGDILVEKGFGGKIF
jgi:hypothetical protein